MSAPTLGAMFRLVRGSRKALPHHAALAPGAGLAVVLVEASHVLMEC
jgi:hypothetical protein